MLRTHLPLVLCQTWEKRARWPLHWAKEHDIWSNLLLLKIPSKMFLSGRLGLVGRRTLCLLRCTLCFSVVHSLSDDKKGEMPVVAYTVAACGISSLALECRSPVRGGRGCPWAPQWVQWIICLLTEQAVPCRANPLLSWETQRTKDMVTTVAMHKASSIRRLYLLHWLKLNRFNWQSICFPSWVHGTVFCPFERAY